MAFVVDVDESKEDVEVMVDIVFPFDEGGFCVVDAALVEGTENVVAVLRFTQPEEGGEALGMSLKAELFQMTPSSLFAKN